MFKGEAWEMVVRHRYVLEKNPIASRAVERRESVF